MMYIRLTTAREMREFDYPSEDDIEEIKRGKCIECGVEREIIHTKSGDTIDSSYCKCD